MARKGSRAMRNDEELGIPQSPRPGPISSANDLAMPSFAVFGCSVRSINWACPTGLQHKTANTRQGSSKRFIHSPPFDLLLGPYTRWNREREDSRRMQPVFLTSPLFRLYCPHEDLKGIARRACQSPQQMLSFFSLFSHRRAEENDAARSAVAL